MARNQAEKVLETAQALADREGDLAPEDRKDIAFCQIDDVEYALQHGTSDSFLAACREIASGEKKGWMLSVAHLSKGNEVRAYPFGDRIQDLLPWVT